MALTHTLLPVGSKTTWFMATGCLDTARGYTGRSLARVAEWQTRRTQNPLLATTCGFESHLGHYLSDLSPTSETDLGDGDLGAGDQSKITKCVAKVLELFFEHHMEAHRRRH